MLSFNDLDVEAAILNLLGPFTSFEKNPNLEMERANEEYVIGRYRNQDSEYIFTNRSFKMRHDSNSNVVSVLYSEIIDAQLVSVPDYKQAAATDPRLRQVSLGLRSGARLVVPVLNETLYYYKETDHASAVQRVGWDVFGMHSFFRKIAVFVAKSDRSSHQT